MRKSEKLLYKSIKKKSKFKTMLLRVFFGCDIPCTVEIGENFKLIHNGLGVVIHPKTLIGNNVSVYQNVTIGGNAKIVDGVLTNVGAPVIEDDCVIFAGACVLGPITIGKGTCIGANSVITKDVPPNSLVYGNPAIVTAKKYDFNIN